MAYIKKIWKDYPNTTTQIKAEDLNNIENGIDDVYSRLVTAESDIDTAETNITNLQNVTKYITATTGSNGDFNIDLGIIPYTGMIIYVRFPTPTNSSSNARLSINNGTTYYPIYYAGVQIIASDCTGKYVKMYLNGTNFEIVDKIKPIYALVTISEQQTLAPTYVIQLNQIVSQFGGKFTLSNGAVVVGSGVKKIKTSAGVFGQGLTGGNYLWAFVGKNGANQGGSILSSAGSYCSTSISPTIFDVAQGDLITL